MRCCHLGTCLICQAFFMMNRDSKKRKLDDDFDDWDDNGAANDDLWGQGELTAEEFDFLEIQATQKVQASSSHHNAVDANCSNVQRTQPNDLKKQQYALEGQLKILSDSLDKTVRELNIERLNRDQIIAQKVTEYKAKENCLHKEIEKLQTTFQFKEQETKSIQNKVHLLEQKLREQSKDNIAVKQRKYTPNENAFLNRFQFGSQVISSKDSSVQTSCADDVETKEHQLQLLAPSGEPCSRDLVSSFVIGEYKPDCKDKSLNFSSVAYASLNNGHVTYELWKYFEEKLKEHVQFLTHLSSLTRGKRNPTLKNIPVLPRSSGLILTGIQQQSKLEEDIRIHHKTVSSCLKNLQSFCPKSGDVLLSKTYSLSQEMLKLVREPDFENQSCPLFPDEEKIDYTTGLPGFMVPLVALAKPETYPDCYSYRNDELAQVLLVLVEWSARKHISLDPVAYVLPIQSLVSGNQGLKCACLTLRLLLGLLPLKRFEVLIRHNVNCLFASVADLCQSISHTQGSDYIQVVATVLDFLGESIAVLGADAINEDECPCSSKLAQGFVVMLWRYHDMCCKNSYGLQPEMEILKQSVLILHLLYTKMKDFLAKKMPVIDQYVVLICGLYSLCKENPSFKSISDMVHDLWHFDQDISPNDSEPDEQMME